MIKFKTIIILFYFSLNVFASSPQQGLASILISEDESNSTQTIGLSKLMQLVRFEGKKKIACPKQTSRTLVILILGQSNAGNQAETLFTADNSRIVNYFHGECFIASDPLLGNAGFGGSQWVRAASKIMKSVNSYDKIILIPAAINGSSVKEWAHNSEFAENSPSSELQSRGLGILLQETLQSAKINGYKITHILWHQGERDAHKMSAVDYKKYLNQIIHKTRLVFPDSKFYVSIASGCTSTSPPDPVIHNAQMTIINNKDHIYQGPNTDLWFSKEYRQKDGCHLNDLGMAMAAEEWSKIIIGTK